ncbi:MAG: SBBP repeat-containing protein, partial [Bacteroidota bacterium]
QSDIIVFVILALLIATVLQWTSGDTVTVRQQTFISEGRQESVQAVSQETKPAGQGIRSVTPYSTAAKASQLSMKRVTNLADVRFSAGFFENKGQLQAGLNFLLQRKGLDVRLYNNTFSYKVKYYTQTSEGIQYDTHTISIDLVGANQNPKISFSGESRDVHNYFLGRGAVSEVHHYQQVVYHDIYPGIDIVFDALEWRQESLGFKYSFVVHPGADPSLIQLRYRGQESLSVDRSEPEALLATSASPVLEIGTPFGAIGEELSAVFVTSGGKNSPVEGSFEVYGDQVSIKTAEYDSTKTLVIDPSVINVVLRRATYYGSEGTDRMNDLNVDNDGNIFVIGTTPGIDVNMSTPGTLKDSVDGANDMIIAKFNADLSELLAATYFGGDNEEDGLGITLDNAGNVYVAGYSASDNLQDAGGATYTTEGGEDMIVARFNNTLTSLQWVRAIGGVENERVNDIVFANNSIYGIGTATSTGLNTIGSDYLGGNSDVLIFSFSFGGGINWARYLGGNRTD